MESGAPSQAPRGHGATPSRGSGARLPADAASQLLPPARHGPSQAGAEGMSGLTCGALTAVCPTVPPEERSSRVGYDAGGTYSRLSEPSSRSASSSRSSLAFTCSGVSLLHAAASMPRSTQPLTCGTGVCGEQGAVAGRAEAGGCKQLRSTASQHPVDPRALRRMAACRLPAARLGGQAGTAQAGHHPQSLPGPVRAPAGGSPRR